VSLRCVVLCLVFFSCSVVMFAQNTGKQPELVMFRLAFFGADSWAPERPDPVSGANPVDDAPKGAPPENTPLRDKPEAIEHQDASSGAGDDSLKGTGDDRMDGLFKQVFAEMDVRLQDSLTEIGRFHVVSAFQRISGKYAKDLLKAAEKRQVTEGEKSTIALDGQTFTPADLDRVASAEIIGVPWIDSYSISSEKGQYKVKVHIEVDMVSVRQKKAVAHFQAELNGQDSDSPLKAIRQAMDSAPDQLTAVVRKSPDFLVKTVITERIGRDVIVSFGKNMGIMQGDEFRVYREDVNSDSPPLLIGRIAIRDVRDRFSIGTVVYEDKPMLAGDILEETRRTGLDVAIQSNLILVLDSSTNNSSVSLGGLSNGIKLTLARGVWDFRPFVEFNAILPWGLPDTGTMGDPYIPVTFSLGVEYTLNYYRLRFAPSLSLGVMNYLATGSAETYLASHLKTEMKGELSFLVFDGLSVFLDGGFYMLIPRCDFLYGYSSILAGGGLNFRL